MLMCRSHEVASAGTQKAQPEGQVLKHYIAPQQACLKPVAQDYFEYRKPEHHCDDEAQQTGFNLTQSGVNAM